MKVTYMLAMRSIPPVHKGQGEEEERKQRGCVGHDCQQAQECNSLHLAGAGCWILSCIVHACTNAQAHTHTYTCAHHHPHTLHQHINNVSNLTKIVAQRKLDLTDSASTEDATPNDSYLRQQDVELEGKGVIDG